MTQKKLRLSAAQARVVASLMENKDRYIVESRFYHWNQVRTTDKEMFWFHRPTLEFLKRKNLIINIEGTKKYFLNPSFASNPSQNQVK
jgi:hypothetical protein